MSTDNSDHLNKPVDSSPQINPAEARLVMLGLELQRIFLNLSHAKQKELLEFAARLQSERQN